MMAIGEKCRDSLAGTPNPARIAGTAGGIDGQYMWLDGVVQPWLASFEVTYA